MLLLKINTLEKENFNFSKFLGFSLVDKVAMELEGKQVRIGVIGAPCIGKV